ncbi:hypothetical protein AB0G15_24590 [Streptosporangium sp. NPDC023825]|uniref:hypothetical protein n=1 Tax=Streptosporangium sp. NPDC023825 TaxID=3154909 RepID=UPI003434707D
MTHFLTAGSRTGPAWTVNLPEPLAVEPPFTWRTAFIAILDGNTYLDMVTTRFLPWAVLQRIQVRLRHTPLAHRQRRRHRERRECRGEPLAGLRRRHRRG